VPGEFSVLRKAAVGARPTAGGAMAGRSVRRKRRGAGCGSLLGRVGWGKPRVVRLPLAITFGGRGKVSETFVIQTKPVYARMEIIVGLYGLPHNTIRRLYNEHKVRAVKYERRCREFKRWRNKDKKRSR